MKISSWCPSDVIQLSTAFILFVHQRMYSCRPSDIAWLQPGLILVSLLTPTMPAAHISTCSHIPSNGTRAEHTWNRHLSLTCTTAPPPTLPCFSFGKIPLCIMYNLDYNIRRWMFSFFHKGLYKNTDIRLSKAYDHFPQLQTCYAQTPLVHNCEYTLRRVVSLQLTRAAPMMCSFTIAT